MPGHHDVYGTKSRALRLTNVYGPGMRIKDARQTFLGIWLRRVIDGEPFEVSVMSRLIRRKGCCAYFLAGHDFFYLAAQITAALACGSCSEAIIVAHGGGKYESGSFRRSASASMSVTS